MRKRLFRSTAIAFVTVGILTTAGPAFANPSPPTNGGNGAGQAANAPVIQTTDPIRARALSELPGLRFEGPGSSGSELLRAWCIRRRASASTFPFLIGDLLLTSGFPRPGRCSTPTGPLWAILDLNRLPLLCRAARRARRPLFSVIEAAEDLRSSPPCGVIRRELGRQAA